MNFTSIQTKKPCQSRQGFHAQRLPKKCSAAREHIDGPAILRARDREFHRAIDGCKEGVITTQTHVASGMKLRSPLSNNDAARVDRFSTEDLDPEPLGL
jgi:hypothetical protein